jgi:hypothetical protein
MVDQIAGENGPIVPLGEEREMGGHVVPLADGSTFVCM